MGGSNALGAWGYIEGFREIVDQYQHINNADDADACAVPFAKNPSDIVVASGSGGAVAPIPPENLTPIITSNAFARFSGTVAGLCVGSYACQAPLALLL
jgi:hypothetical protein